MSIFRIEKSKDFTCMSNTHLKDKRMSLKAKGLLSLMLSLPDDWDYSINGLCAICVENRAAVKSGLKELQELGYLQVIKYMPHDTSSGRIEYEYNVFERPQDAQKQGTEKQGIENQHLEYQPLENPIQVNTNVLNTKEINTKEINTKDKKERKKNSFDILIAEYAKGIDESNREQVVMLLGEWLKVRKAKRAAMTDYAIQLNLNKLDALAKQSGMDIPQYLEAVIAKGWAAFYAVNNYNTQQGGAADGNHREESARLIEENGYGYVF